MVFFASVLLSRVGVRPVLDRGGVLAGSGAEVTLVGLAVAADLCARVGWSPGISPFDVGWQPARATTLIVSPRTTSALVDLWSGSGTGESIG